MAKIQELRDKVEKALRKYPETRNSDITLTIAIWKMFFPGKVFDNKVNLKDLYDLPREDNIKRIRAKLQEEALYRVKMGTTTGSESCFLPTNEKVAKARNIEKDLWEYSLGYSRKPINEDQKELF